LAALLKATELDPAYLEAHVRLAEYYAEKKLYKKSEAEVEQAKKINADQVEGLLVAGQAHAAQQRWEAAKALSQIVDPAAVGVLVKTLEDKTFDLCWLAAEGLINIGKPSLVPLLHRLIEKTDSVWVREGAHHVFHDIHDPNLKLVLRPVLDALEDSDTHIQIPFAAEAALKSLE